MTAWDTGMKTPVKAEGRERDRRGGEMVRVTQEDHEPGPNQERGQMETVTMHREEKKKSWAQVQEEEEEREEEERLATVEKIGRASCRER